MTKPTTLNINRFCVAPLFKYTDVFCNYFHRQLTKKSVLYTEMKMPKDIFSSKKIFSCTKTINPIAIQLAGRNILELVKCAKIVYLQGYKEINLNVGCPSKHAKYGKFGVFLMKESHLVTKIVQSINENVPIPVTIKTRLGINDQDNFNFLNEFIYNISKKTNCKTFILHARKAFSKKKKKRKYNNLPNLDYDAVYKIKRNFPHLNIIINGGISTIEESLFHLKKVDGVMLGKIAYKNPSLLYEVDEIIFKSKKKNPINKIQLIKNMYPYIEKQLSSGVTFYKIIRHMIGLFYKEKVSRLWKNFISIETRKKGVCIKSLDHVLSKIMNILK